MTLKSIDDLTPWADNPRRIKEKAAKGLGKSLVKYGDISGIVYNSRTKRLVAGHRRVEQLKRRGAKIIEDDGFSWIKLGDDRFLIRIVDLDEKTEREANITANNQQIAGEWDDSIFGHLDLIGQNMPPEEFTDLGFDELAKSLGGGGADFDEPENAVVDDDGDDCPVCGGTGKKMEP